MPQSLVEEMLKVWVPFDYCSRLQIGLYSFRERRPGPHRSALSQDEFICSVPKLRVMFKNPIDLLPEARILAPQLVLYHRLWSFGLGRFGTRARNLVRGR